MQWHVLIPVSQYGELPSNTVNLRFFCLVLTQILIKVGVYQYELR
ncbi:MAG: hypothetical protein JWQ71_3896 [Pedosphaera sp.]|nr:hypothetical protein [Pedosphaera sp.]